MRELWILLARMVFGRQGRGDYQRKDWYSEALFARDDRFDLTAALQASTRPAAAILSGT